MTPIRWMIDFDDTICGLVPAWCKAANRALKTHYTPEDVDSWDFFNSDPALAKVIWEDTYPRRSFLIDACKPVPGARKAIKQLVASGDTITIVTARHPSHGPWVRAWLHRNMFPDLQVIATGNGVNKAIIAIELGATHAIDDNPVQIAALSDADHIERLWIPDRAYNRSGADHPKARRLMDWEAFDRL